MMFFLAKENRLFLGSMVLSLCLHLGLAGLGVMTGWGSSLTPQKVLEVNLVAPQEPGGENGSGTMKKKAPAAAVATAPEVKRRSPVVRKARLPKVARPVAWEVEKRKAAPKPIPAPAVPLTVASAPAHPSPGPQTGNGSSHIASGGAGSGHGSGGFGRAGLGRGHGSGGRGQARYFSLIRARILAHRHYPYLARQRRQEGVVRVRFRVSPVGALCQGVRVVRPSGHALLDEQARQCVLAAAPFPPFPPELRRDHLTIEVPIVYRLMEEGF